jgi:hypothetical protein
MEKQASKRKRNAIISILALSIGLILGLNVPEAKAGTLFYDNFESYTVGNYLSDENSNYETTTAQITNEGFDSSKGLLVKDKVIYKTKFGNNSQKISFNVKFDTNLGIIIYLGNDWILLQGYLYNNIFFYAYGGGYAYEYYPIVTNSFWSKVELTIVDPNNLNIRVTDLTNQVELFSYDYETSNLIAEINLLQYSSPILIDNLKIEQVTNDDLIIRRFLGPEKNAILNKLKSIYYEVEYYNGDNYDKYYSFLAHFYDDNTDEWVNTLLPAALKIVEPTNKKVVFVNYFQLIPDGFYLPPNKNYYVDMEVLRYDSINKVWENNYRYYSHAFEFSLVEGVPAPPQPSPPPAPEAPEIPTESEACTLPENPTILNYVQTGICKAFYFLFIPNETQREDLSDGIEQAVGNITDQKPIGYIKQIYDTWKEVNVVEYEGEGKAPVEIPVIGTTIKNIIAILLWVVFAKYIVKRIGSITL